MSLSLDLEAPLQEGACAIRVALVPVGGTSGREFRRLASHVHTSTSLDLFAITHGQRRGTLRLRFVESGGGPSDWDELFAQRRVRAVVGLCHSPSERDLGASFRAFMRRVEGFPSTAQVRCLVFDPPEAGQEPLVAASELPGASATRSLVVVPPGQSAAELRLHVERLLEDLAGELLRDLRAEADTPQTTLLSTPVDAAAASERSSMLRLLSSASGRVSGRQLKRKADFRLMLGLAADAKGGYERAIELLSRSGADAVWHAAALEGASAASLLVLAQRVDAARAAGADSASSADVAALEEQYDEALGVARRRLEEAAGLCVARGGRALEVAVEIGFRLARLVGECAERERARLAAEARDLMGVEAPPPSPWRGRLIEASQRLHRHGYELAVASDGERPPLGYQLQLRVCLAAAALSSELGQERKSAFYLLEAARRYRDNYQWLAAHEVLLVAAPQLQLGPLQWLQLRAPWRPPMPGEPRALLTDDAWAVVGGAVVYRMIDSASRGWSHLREVVLAMLLEASEAASDAPLYASYALFTLRLMEAALPDAVQMRLVTLLEQAALELSPPMAAPAIGLPWLLSLRPLTLPAERLPHKQDDAASGERPPSATGVVFTFSPFEARRRREASAREAARVRWVCGERVCAVARLANPLSVPLRIDLLALHATVLLSKAGASSRGGEPDGEPGGSPPPRFVAFGRQVELPAHCTGFDVELSGRVEGGAAGGDMTVLLHGVEARAYGAVCVHPVDANGAVALLAPSAYTASERPRRTPRPPNAAATNGEGDAHERGLYWQRPSPLEIPLAPPLPLLVAELSSAHASGLADLHPYQRTSLVLRLTNVGLLPAWTIRATLSRGSAAARLTRAGRFIWYDVTPQELFDESECDGARARTHFELGLDALAAQLPLPPTHTLQLPVSLTASGQGVCACDVELRYDAHGEGSSAAGGDGEASDGGARWSRRLTLPLRLPVAAGLTLSPEALVQSDPHALYLRGTAPAHAHAPPGCLLVLEVSNQHESATFELSCRLGPAVAPSSASASTEQQQPSMLWPIPPRSSQRLLLPLCCIDDDAPHPLPESLALLESYMEQRKPPVTPEEAAGLRRAHTVKAVLLTAVRLHWRRLGPGGESGTLPLAPLRLDETQVATLRRPRLVLHATLDAFPERDASGQPAPPMRRLRVVATNTSSRPLDATAMLRVRAHPRGATASAQRLLAARRASEHRSGGRASRDAQQYQSSGSFPPSPTSSERASGETGNQRRSRTPPNGTDGDGSRRITPDDVDVGRRSRASSMEEDSQRNTPDEATEGEAASRGVSRRDTPDEASAFDGRPASPSLPLHSHTNNSSSGQQSSGSASPLHHQSSGSVGGGSSGALPVQCTSSSSGGESSGVLPSWAGGGHADAPSHTTPRPPARESPSAMPGSAPPPALTDEEAAGARTPMRWERAEAEAEAEAGLDEGGNGAALTDDELIAADDEDDPGSVDGALILAGAIDALLPALGAGETHEHVVAVGCTEPGAYRLTVECIDLDAPAGAGAAALLANTFSDCEWS